MFLKNILSLIEQSGITKNKLATDLGLGKNSFVDWGKGASPSIDTALKIANYFNVSVDYLLKGDDAKMSATDDLTRKAMHESVIEDYKNANNEDKKLMEAMYPSLNFNPIKSTEDPLRAELIENYDSMNVAGQEKLLEHSRLLLKDDQYLACGQLGLGAEA